MTGAAVQLEELNLLKEIQNNMQKTINRKSNNTRFCNEKQKHNGTLQQSTQYYNNSAETIPYRYDFSKISVPVVRVINLARSVRKRQIAINTN